MTDDVRVAREALQAIIDHTAEDWDSVKRYATYHDAITALVALEAAEATQAERDEKIRELGTYVIKSAKHAKRAQTTDSAMGIAMALEAVCIDAEAILVLVGEPTKPTPAADLADRIAETDRVMHEDVLMQLSELRDSPRKPTPEETKPERGPYNDGKFV